MDSYLMMLYVTLDQEQALKSFFVDQGWAFCKPDISAITDKVGPLKPTKLQTVTLTTTCSPEPKFSQHADEAAESTDNDEATAAQATLPSPSRRPLRKRVKRISYSPPPFKQAKKSTKTPSGSLTSDDEKPVDKSTTETHVTSLKNIDGTDLIIREDVDEDITVKLESLDPDNDASQMDDDGDNDDDFDGDDDYDPNAGIVKSAASPTKRGKKMRTKAPAKVKCEPSEKLNVQVEDYGIDGCFICKKMFTDAPELTAHMKTCLVGYEVCDICGLAVTQIRKHKLRHDPINAKYDCDTCGNKYFQRFELEFHKRKHADKTPCEACGKMVTFIERHAPVCRKALADKALIRCMKCLKVFASLADKQDHMGICSRETFSCEQCGISYTQLGSLNTHNKKQHPGDTARFICDTCGKQFQTKFKLSEHEHAHKPKVLCKICGKMVYATKRHKQACQNPKLRKCDYCDRTIKGSSSHLRTHIARHHGHANVGKKGEYYCKKCGEKYMYKGWVEAHERECQGFGLVLQPNTEPEISATPTDTDGQTISEQVEVAMVLPSDLDTLSGDTMLTDLSTNSVYVIKQ